MLMYLKAVTTIETIDYEWLISEILKDRDNINHAGDLCDKITELLPNLLNSYDSPYFEIISILCNINKDILEIAKIGGDSANSQILAEHVRKAVLDSRWTKISLWGNNDER